MDEGSDTGEKLALKFVCENFAAKFIYPFSRKREIVDYFNINFCPYDRLRRFSDEPYLLSFSTLVFI